MGHFVTKPVHPAEKQRESHVYGEHGSSAHPRIVLTQSNKEVKLLIPLTEREIFDITRSWRTISANMIGIGVSMFLSMFETSDQVRNMFEQFRTVDNLSDLRTSRALENHALLVMNALDESITNLDDEAYLIESLLHIGKSHRRFENFGPHIFWAIEEPFISSVKQTLSDKCSPRMENIYRKAIKFILTTLIMGFEEDFIVNK